ncbi:MAG: tyrosine-protein phosphatase [Coriobacteriales bacterium]|nr:tyrosine-protein phosphatase [Coriobacteriales bacterium]
MGSLRHVKVTIVAVLCVAAFAFFGLCGCGGNGGSGDPLGSSGGGERLSVTAPVHKDSSFGGVYIDVTIDEFNKLGFEYGDCVDISFSNGYQLNGIPYYNGYYVNVGDPLLVGYPGYPHVEAAVNYGSPLWDTAGLTDADSATITLVQAGAYRDVQEAFNISYGIDRDAYEGTDLQWANFRALSGGDMKPGIAYRSASPIDNEYNRVAYVDKAMRDAGVAFVLNLSDNKSEAHSFVKESKAQGLDMKYIGDLHSAGAIAYLDLSASYPTQSFAQKLVGGLELMIESDGPYLIHCIEGKDRTGFVCALLEALCGASYDEMAADYMETFANYYGITLESDPAKYNAILHLNLDGMLRFLAGADDDVDLRTLDYQQAARDYLRWGGMSDEDIDLLVEQLTQ